MQLQAESDATSPSLPMERPTRSFREPLFVSSPGFHVPKSLSPVASPVATSPVAAATSPVASTATPTSPLSAPVQAAANRRPPIPSAKPDEGVQERTSDRLKAERESKEDSSSESSDESLTSDAESTDLLDEARDTFDTSK